MQPLFMKILLKILSDLVPMAGVEPAQLTLPPPQDGVSTNSTTSAVFTRLSRAGLKQVPWIRPVVQSF